MFIKENVLLAVAGLKSNKMRAFLTMLGIIIGIGAVIAIVSIGDAITNNVTGTMLNVGAGNIYVYVAQRDNDSVYNQAGSSTNVNEVPDEELLTQEQIDTMEKKFSSQISAVSTMESGGTTQVKNGSKYANVYIYGANVGSGDVKNLNIEKGRYLRDNDIAGQRNVAVVSDKFVSNMFPHGEPLGKTFDIDTDKLSGTFTVVGVYKSDSTGIMGASSAKDARTELYVPIGIIKQTADYQNYAEFEIKSKDVQNVSAFTDKLQKYFDRLYKDNTKYKCCAYNEANMLSQVTSLLGVISTAVAAIAAIALLVGGIGVMNIMLVSVTERTREIGTRKALGARGRYIKMQFITESVIICVIGGIIGVIVGLLLAWAGTSLMGMKFKLSVPAVFISVGFSMLIGVFFGYYPAKKAASLNPIDALRYE